MAQKIYYHRKPRILWFESLAFAIIGLGAGMGVYVFVNDAYLRYTPVIGESKKVVYNKIPYSPGDIFNVSRTYIVYKNCPGTITILWSCEDKHNITIPVRSLNVNLDLGENFRTFSVEVPKILGTLLDTPTKCHQLVSYVHDCDGAKIQFNPEPVSVVIIP